MPKKSTEKKSKPKRKKQNFVIMGLNYISVGLWLAIKYIFIAIYSVFKWLYFGLRWLFGKIAKKKKENALKEEFPEGPVPEIKVVEPIKGDYNAFWSKLKESDSLIGLVIGARGSGKSAVALSIVENLKDFKKGVFAMGFSDLPGWIKIVNNISEIKNDSLVVIDEGGILFSSRDSMSNSNKLLSDLLFIARHKNLTILFISQNSSNLEVNTLRQADFIVLKKPSLLQKSFERKIVAKIYENYSSQFEKYRDDKGISLVYSEDFIGFVKNDLPSFWSSRVSKSFR